VWTKSEINARAVAFLPDGEQFVAAVDPGSLWVCDPMKPGVEEIATPGRRIRAVAFVPQRGKMLAYAGDDGVVRFWEIGRGACGGELAAGVAVRSIALAPDGTRLALAGNDKFQVWSLDPPKRLWEHSTGGQDGEGDACVVGFSPSGTELATGGGKPGRGWVKVWNAWDDESGELWQHLGSTAEGLLRHKVNCFVFLPGRSTLISGSEDRWLVQWDVSAWVHTP
jgi:WD40 repeat protein